MKLKVIAPVALVFSVALVLVFISVISYQNARETVDWAKGKELTGLSAMIEELLREEQHQAVAEAEMLAALPQVGELAAKGDRDGLIKMLMPGYRKEVTKYGIESSAIILPPATTLLRLHDPDKFGDDQSVNRPIYVFANQTREVESGLEISSVAGIRGVAPIYNGDIHVGALEWAIGLEPLVADLKSITGAEVAVMIKGSVIPAQSHIRDNQSHTLKDFIAAQATDWTYLSGALRETDVDQANEAAVSTRTVAGIDVGVVKVPLFDFSGRNVGVVLAVKEISAFGRTLKDTLVHLTMAAGIGLLVTAGVSLLIISGLLLRPLERLGARLKSLAGGDFSTKVEAVARRDEIGVLAASIESLRVDLLRRYPPGSAPPLPAADQNQEVAR